MPPDNETGAPPHEPPRCVILDVDGTLVDSNDAHARAWVEALAEYRHRVRFERVRPLIGMSSDHLLAALDLASEGPEAEAIAARRSEIFRERHLPTLAPTPGAADLVRHLRERGFVLVVATSATRDDLAPLLDVAGVPELLEDATSADDAERGKPAPDVVEAALAHVGCAAQEAIMIGDTPYDIETAAAAHVPCIAVRCGGWEDSYLAGAIAIYDDPAELLRRFADSPLTVPEPGSA